MAKCSKHITISKPLYDKVAVVCNKQNRSFSNFIEFLLKIEIEKYQEIQLKEKE